MLIAVTGATGFLGLNLVEYLTRLGWDVTALHRVTSELTYLRRFPVRPAEGALEDRASLVRAMPEGVDVVFHRRRARRGDPQPGASNPSPPRVDLLHFQMHHGNY